MEELKAALLGLLGKTGTEKFQAATLFSDEVNAEERGDGSNSSESDPIERRSSSNENALSIEDGEGGGKDV